MRTRIFYLPTIVYALSFLVILIIYAFGWSDLYPKLHGKLIIFLSATVFISFIFGVYEYFQPIIKIQNEPLDSLFVKRSMSFILGGYFLDFLYERSIPIVSTFINSAYSYKDFVGIPSFHSILSTFSIYFSILMFDHYLITKSKKDLMNFVITLLPFVLLMNRGAFMIIFFAVLYLLLMRTDKIRLKSFGLGAAVFGSILFLFGVIGNIRQEQTKADKEFLLRVGGASDKFIESGIPSEYYWSYVYIISPVGNLQYLMDEREDEFRPNLISKFITTQLFPDFISKRLTPIFVSEDEMSFDDTPYLVTPVLNATTTYFPSYLLLGTFGLILMFLAILSAMLTYPRLLSIHSKYHLSAIASLNSLILLSTFNNMWYAIGTVLLWPLILRIFEKYKFK